MGLKVVKVERPVGDGRVMRASMSVASVQASPSSNLSKPSLPNRVSQPKGLSIQDSHFALDFHDKLNTQDADQYILVHNLLILAIYQLAFLLIDSHSRLISSKVHLS
jgi:hypothetical protein